jgi:hypothetical protein
MNINVPAWARDHFWEEPPLGHEEFWSFRFPPPCAAGDTLFFKFDGVTVASAVVSRVERPGLTKCAGTGRFGNGHKVYWHPSSFRDLRQTAETGGLYR